MRPGLISSVEGRGSRQRSGLAQRLLVGVFFVAGHLVLALSPVCGQAPSPPPAAPVDSWLPVRTFELDNGVRLHVVRRPLSSWVSAGWAVRAGAADDPVGGSGMAHLVEHLLYTGSSNVGTRDWRVEQPLLEEEARLVEGLASEDSSAGRLQLEEVRARLGRLQLPGDLARRWIASGIRSEGALTTKDFSLYRASFPRRALQSWMELEVERLARPAFRMLAREQDVVVEENLQRVGSVPQAPVEEGFDRYFWGESPYGRPPDDQVELVRVLRRQLQAFHRQHYRPEKLVVSVVGDVDAEEVLELARRTFGALDPQATGELEAEGAPRAGPEALPVPSSDVAGSDHWSARPRGRRESARCDCRPSARIRFATVPYDHDDAVALDVLAAILNGRSGRLMLGLVEGSSDVFAAYASHKAQARAGTFSLVVEATEEGTGASRLGDLIDGLRGQIAGLVNEETALRAAELERARNVLLASAAREVKASEALRSRLLIDDALGDGHRLRRWRQRVEEVTVERLAALVRSFLLSLGEGPAPGVEFLVLHGEPPTVGGNSQ